MFIIYTTSDSYLSTLLVRILQRSYLSILENKWQRDPVSIKGKENLTKSSNMWSMSFMMHWE